MKRKPERFKSTISRAVGYVRVDACSPDRDAQIEAIEIYCACRGVFLVDVLDDIDGIERLIASDKKIDGVIIFSVDRLFTDALDCMLVFQRWARTRCAMSYRDDLTAAQARIAALEQENATLRAELAKVPARRELLRSMMRDTDSPDEMTHRLDRLEERIFTDHSRATAATEEIISGLSKRLAHERELDEFRHETDLMKRETKRILSITISMVIAGPKVRIDTKGKAE